VSRYTLATMEHVDELKSLLADKPLVAIDTEFHAERRYMPRLYLVQLRIPGDRTWIFDTLAWDPIRAIRKELRSTPWLVHAGFQDLRLMNRLLGGVPDEVIDVQLAYGLCHPEFPAAYKTLCRTVLGRELEKAATLSDWSKRPLTPQQLDYAAEDVELLHELWERLQDQLASRGRVDLAKTAFADARERAIAGPELDLLWHQLNFSNTLAPRNAAIARQLAIWREERGQMLDQPARSVMSDGVLRDLARRAPTTVNALRSNRRLPKGLGKNHADELVEMINEALAGPTPTPLQMNDPRWEVFELLGVIARAAGRKEGFSARLALPKVKREQLALVPPPDRRALQDALGWREPLLGDALLAAFNGSINVGLSNGLVDLVPKNDR